MPTIVDILTFNSNNNCWHFKMSRNNSMLSLVEHEKYFYNFEAWFSHEIARTMSAYKKV